MPALYCRGGVFLTAVFIEKVLINRDKKVYKLIAVVLFAALIGLSINYVVNIGIETYGQSRFEFCTISEFGLKILNSFVNFSRDFWVNKNKYSYIFLIYPLIFAFFGLKSIVSLLKNKKAILLVIGTLMVSLICIAQYFLIFASSERSFFNLIITVLLLIAFYLCDNSVKKRRKTPVLLAIGLILYSQIIIIDQNEKKYKEKQEAVQAIKKHNLKEGYARVFQYPYSIITDDGVRIYTYTYSENEIRKMYYLEYNGEDEIDNSRDFFFTVEKKKIEEKNLNTTFLKTLELIWENDELLIYKVNKKYASNIFEIITGN